MDSFPTLHCLDSRKNYWCTRQAGGDCFKKLVSETTTKSTYQLPSLLILWLFFPLFVHVCLKALIAQAGIVTVQHVHEVVYVRGRQPEGLDLKQNIGRCQWNFLWSEPGPCCKFGRAKIRLRKWRPLSASVGKKWSVEINYIDGWKLSQSFFPRRVA